MATVANVASAPVKYESGAPRRLFDLVFNAAVAVGLTIATCFCALALERINSGSEDVAAKALSYVTSIVLHRGYIPFLELFFFYMGSTMLLRGYFSRRREKKLFGLVAKEWNNLLRKTHKRVQEEREKRKEQTGQDNTLPEPDTIPLHLVGVVLRALDKLEPRLRRSLLGNRIYFAVRRYDKTKTSTEVDDILKILSDIDLDSKEAFYSSMKFFTWLIPALGFIGTVVGIGLGVAGFGELIEKADSFAQVQELLPEVTQNLGIAFDTTLLALFLTAIMTGVMSYQQKREEDLLTQVDTFCMEEVAGNFEDVDTHSIMMRRLFQEQNQLLSQSFSNLVDSTNNFDSSIGKVHDHLGETARSTKSLADIFERTGSSNDDVSETTTKLAEVSRTLQDFVEQGSMADAAEFTKGVAELKTAVEPIGEAVRQLAAVAQNLSGLADLSTVAKELAEAAKRMETGAQHAREGGMGMAEAGEGLRTVIGSNREVLENVKGVMSETTESIHDLRDIIFATNKTITSVQEAIQLVADQVKRR
jgi:archaellum component FlaC